MGELPQTPQRKEVLKYLDDNLTLQRNHDGSIRVERGHIKAHCPLCSDQGFNFEISIEKDGHPMNCWVCSKRLNWFTLKDELEGHSNPGRQPRRPSSNTPPRRSTPPSDISSIADALPGSKDEKKTFAPSWIEPFHGALLDDRHGALSYLKNRGFTEKTIRHFKLGVKDEVRFCIKAGEGKKYETHPGIVIPSLITLKNPKTNQDEPRIGLVQYRSIPPCPKAISREADMETVLFNEGALLETPKTVVICEGAMDAMSAWQAGHYNVVGTTGGASGFKPRWIEQLEPIETIVLAYDADTAGREGFLMAVQRLGEDRVHTVDLPENYDLNKILGELGSDRLHGIITSSKAMPLEDIHSLQGVIASMQDSLMMGEQLNKWISWKWSSVCAISREILPGDLVVFAGPPSAGKTTMAMDQAIHSTITHGIPSLLICLEMTPEELVVMVVSNILQVKTDDIDLDVLSEAGRQLKDLPLYFEYHHKPVSRELVIDNMTKSFKRYGVRLVMLDNLHFLARFAREEMPEQGRISQGLKQWAVNYKSAVLLIVHTRKNSEPGRLAGMQEWRGNAAVAGDANIGIELVRIDIGPSSIADLWNQGSSKPQHRYLPHTAVVLDKVRGAGGGTFTFLYQEGDFNRFRAATQDDFEALTEAESAALKRVLGESGKKQYARS